MEYIYTKDEKEAALFACDLSCATELGYDIETAGFEPLNKKSFILLDQFATPDACYIFDSRYIRPDVYKPILEDPSIIKIGHNLKFEYQHNKIKKGIELEGVFDTMLAYRVLTSGLKDDGKGGWVPIGAEGNKRFFPYKSLAFLALKYCGINLDKSVRDTFEEFLNSPSKDFTKEQLDYAAKDAQIVLQLKNILTELLGKEELLPTADLEFRFLPACAEMELNGVQLNTKRWREIIKSAQKIQAKARQLADSHLVGVSDQTTLFGDSAINIDSPIQVIRAFKKLGFNIENTDVKTLKNVKHPLAAALLDYRAYEKLLTTYGESLLKNINKETKRLHFTLHQLGADTGRLSSEKPNIQNIPKDVDGEEDGVKLSFRDCFVAPPGKKLLTADYSQCELRILAEESQDKKFLEIFRANQDLHIITAQQVFDISDNVVDTFLKLKKKDKPGVDLLQLFNESEVKDYKFMNGKRDQTKTINFGIVYGLSAYSLMERYGMTEDEATDLLDRYFGTYKGIKLFLDKNSKETLKNRWAKTILGRKRFFHMPDPDSEDFNKARGAVRRMGNNHVIQGCNADITKEALASIRAIYKQYGPEVKLLFTVHDEIVSEVPEELVEEIKPLKAEAMRQAFHKFIKTVSVGVNDQVTVAAADWWSK